MAISNTDIYHKVKLKWDWDFDWDDIFGKDKICTKLNKKETEVFNLFIKKHKIKDNKENKVLISHLKFTIGKCKPILVVSGLYATKLQLEITDCSLIKKNHSHIYKDCFSNRECKNTEKRIWLSENYMNSKDDHECFAHLMAINFVQNKRETEEEKHIIEDFYIKKFSGFKVTYLGDTKETKKASRCGLGASENLLDKFSYFGRKSPVGFYDFNQKLIKDYGYIPGINLFGLPYDWRASLESLTTQRMFKQAIELAYNFSNKKVIVLGHSLGTMVSYNQIMKMPIAERKQKIDSFNAVCPLFSRIYKSIKSCNI